MKLKIINNFQTLLLKPKPLQVFLRQPINPPKHIPRGFLTVRQSKTRASPPSWWVVWGFRGVMDCPPSCHVSADRLHSTISLANH